MKTFLSKLKRAVVTVRPQKSEIAAWLCFGVLFGAVISGACLVKPSGTDGKSVVLDKVVRLHVLANSDSDEDQALKLKVRDAIVEKTAALFNDCRDIYVEQRNNTRGIECSVRYMFNTTKKKYKGQGAGNTEKTRF